MKYLLLLPLFLLSSCGPNYSDMAQNAWQRLHDGEELRINEHYPTHPKDAFYELFEGEDTSILFVRQEQEEFHLGVDHDVDGTLDKIFLGGESTISTAEGPTFTTSSVDPV